MKKTIIALMALAGCAAAAVNDTVASALADAKYVAGESFAITLNLNGAWTGLTTTDSHLTLGTQAPANVHYVNFTNGNEGWFDVAGWSVTDTSTDTAKSVYASYTMTSESQPTGYWFTPVVQINNDGNFEVANGVRNDSIATLTIAYDKDTDTTTFTATRNGLSSGSEYNEDPTNWQSKTQRTNTEYNDITYSVTTQFSIVGLTLDASKFNFNDTGVGSVLVTVVPEPATATLSLLALCGLAARRRRV